ncbi:MAG: riboflavin synthase [Gaiellales bacterium]|jgi:riboflavin synthase|nr:riboflavin synthase [Gaiellales bacterium]MDX6549788.1 riboflavin synthase [Gaiellales bacterium]
MVFTGIVQEQGVVVEAPPRLVLAAAGIAADARLGDSVAVDGCCLTVTAIDGDRLSFDAVPETLRRSTLGALEPGSPVNLEPALRAGDRMGGHLVQGHVDAVGRLESALEEGEAVNMRFAATNDVMHYVIEKGSICVNGVSLTVTAFDSHGFSVSVIPHTREVTNLGRLRPGDGVNLEADLVGKYVQRLMPAGATVVR